MDELRLAKEVERLAIEERDRAIDAGTRALARGRALQEREGSGAAQERRCTEEVRSSYREAVAWFEAATEYELLRRDPLAVFADASDSALGCIEDLQPLGEQMDLASDQSELTWSPFTSGNR